MRGIELTGLLVQWSIGCALSRSSVESSSGLGHAFRLVRLALLVQARLVQALLLETLLRQAEMARRLEMAHPAQSKNSWSGARLSSLD